MISKRRRDRIGRRSGSVAVWEAAAAKLPEKDALRKQLDDLKAAEKKELEKVLTPAQKERLKEILTGKAPDTSK